MPEDKRKYVHKLYLETEKRLDAWFGGTTDSPAQQRKARGEDLRKGEGGNWVKQLPVPDETRAFQRPLGLPSTLAELARLDGSPPVRDQARDAIDVLEAWAANPEAPPFFALLGEYGIGKTTTLKQFTRHLLGKLADAQAAKAGLPLPIYVDLRDYVGERKENVPTIEELLDEVIRRSWKLSDRTVSAKDILRLVLRGRGAASSSTASTRRSST